MRWSSKYGERKGDGDDVWDWEKMKKNERSEWEYMEGARVMVMMLGLRKRWKRMKGDPARLPPCSGNLVEKELPLVS